MFLRFIIFIFLITFNFSIFAQGDVDKFQNKLAALEAATGGRIGVSAFNTDNNMTLQYRGDERFPMGCTSKVIGVGAILKKSMSDKKLLQERVRYTQNDLENWAPITKTHLETGMSVAELAAAAISYSDNTAMNLLVAKLGGLEKMNAFARTLQDYSFRQDHNWPSEALSGGLGNAQDSSTPHLMLQDLKQLTLGTALGKEQRELLISWLKKNTTGDARIRAGVPKGWVVGDKTGTGVYYGTTNDIGIIWAPGCKPILVAIYYTHQDKAAVKRDDVVAQIARGVVNAFRVRDVCLKGD